MPEQESTPFTFTCSVCGERHTGLPDLAYDSPLYYHAMSEEDRAASAELTADTCIIRHQDGSDFFIRGCLEVPLQGRIDLFAYGVWVSLSAKSFKRYQELFDHPDPSGEPAYFGWFANQLPGYPNTLSLKTRVHLRPYPMRPRIELEPTDHPLAVEQREGISIARLQEIYEANEHAA